MYFSIKVRISLVPISFSAEEVEEETVVDADTTEAILQQTDSVADLLEAEIEEE